MGPRRADRTTAGLEPSVEAVGDDLGTASLVIPCQRIAGGIRPGPFTASVSFLATLTPNSSSMSTGRRSFSFRISKSGRSSTPGAERGAHCQTE